MMPGGASKDDRRVPLKSQMVTVELLTVANAVVGSAMVMTDGNGVAQIGDTAGATQVRVTDRFGNALTTSLS